MEPLVSGPLDPPPPLSFLEKGEWRQQQRSWLLFLPFWRATHNTPPKCTLRTPSHRRWGRPMWEEEGRGTGAQFQEEATDGRRTRRRGWRGILLRTRQTRGSFERSSVYNPAFPGPLYLRPPVAETHRPQGSIGRTFRHTEEAIGARGGEGEYLFE